VPDFDPAAAPLGTDAEAAGTPMPTDMPAPAAEARPLPGFTPAPQDGTAPDAAPAKPLVAAVWPEATPRTDESVRRVVLIGPRASCALIRADGCARS